MYGLDVWNEIEVTLGSKIYELHKMNNLQIQRHLHTFGRTQSGVHFGFRGNVPIKNESIKSRNMKL